MTLWTKATRAGLLACALGGALSGLVRAESVLDMGQQVPDLATLRQGLFPEEACAASAAGCDGRRGLVRYSLSAVSFRAGSAELPDGLRQQLSVFAQLLRGRKADGMVFSIESHADASGTPEQARQLSQRRANAVKAYLVRQGVDPAMLVAVGRGAQALRVAGNPYAAQNRRIEIARTELN